MIFFFFLLGPQLGVELEGDLPLDERRCCVEIVEGNLVGEERMLTPRPLLEEWRYLIWFPFGGFYCEESSRIFTVLHFAGFPNHENKFGVLYVRPYRVHREKKDCVKGWKQCAVSAIFYKQSFLHRFRRIFNSHE
jgi:hypothetical protein